MSLLVQSFGTWLNGTALLGTLLANGFVQAFARQETIVALGRFMLLLDDLLAFLILRVLHSSFVTR